MWQDKSGEGAESGAGDEGSMAGVARTCSGHTLHTVVRAVAIDDRDCRCTVSRPRRLNKERLGVQGAGSMSLPQAPSMLPRTIQAPCKHDHNRKSMRTRLTSCCGSLAEAQAEAVWGTHDERGRV